MKWKIESIVHNNDPTITVRIALFNDDGTPVLNHDGTPFCDQNCLPEDATEQQIYDICEEMCGKHVKSEKKDFSYLIGAINGITK